MSPSLRAIPGTQTTPKSLTVLGATGSIGQSTLRLVEQHPERFSLDILTAHDNVEALAELARRFSPRQVVIGNEAHYAALKGALANTSVEVAAGEEALIAAAAAPCDFVMAAIVGAAGLAPTLAAIQAGRTVGLANKECLVAAGELVMRSCRQSGATLLPVDSEHNAIFQVIECNHNDDIEKVILTASGGPLREMDAQSLTQVTPEQAVAHPNWSMGAKISVDSATLMNKGLEVIEAHHLFSLPPEKLEVVVHPESIVHSFVHFVDGSVIAQMSPPDMIIPIAHTLHWPERHGFDAPKLDMVSIGSLHFEAPDHARFPCLGLAYDAMKAGQSMPAVLNAANEVAVHAFLDKRIGFTDIQRVIGQTLDSSSPQGYASLEDIQSIDAKARRIAETFIT